ncbi:single-strand binding protein [Desulfovibrio sp. X2]|uniref:single-stranded DNA-binding protein n=1 Tax=Desulfovibrio sp. X2 TaxID=941449 RepID=UPI000358BEEB|nr:single-stranded DNA-binding protein [Desulfovibrio sp. X2]EPR37334.1 single-strand binding protein [Desulfovibrio sp. X2]
MAGSLNKVMIIGRMGSDAKLSYLPSGQPVTNFNVATDESYKDRNSGEKIERTEWHRIAVFGKSAEFCANYLGKGRLVYVEGALRTRKWQDKDGQDRYTTEIVVQPFGGTVQGLDSPRGQAMEQGGDAYAPPQQRQAPQQQQRGGGRPQQQRQPSPYEEEDLGPAFPSEASGMDDVPF